jgi:hypothetical protein
MVSFNFHVSIDLNRRALESLISAALRVTLVYQQKSALKVLRFRHCQDNRMVPAL